MNCIHTAIGLVDSLNTFLSPIGLTLSLKSSGVSASIGGRGIVGAGTAISVPARKTTVVSVFNPTISTEMVGSLLLHAGIIPATQDDLEDALSDGESSGGRIKQYLEELKAEHVNDPVEVPIIDLSYAAFIAGGGTGGLLGYMSWRKGLGI